MEDTLIQVRWSTQEMLSWIQQAGYSNFLHSYLLCFLGLFVCFSAARGIKSQNIS